MSDEVDQAKSALDELLAGAASGGESESGESTETRSSSSESGTGSDPIPDPGTAGEETDMTTGIDPGDLADLIGDVVGRAVQPLQDEVRAVRAENKKLGKELKRVQKTAGKAVSRVSSDEEDAAAIGKAAAKQYLAFKKGERKEHEKKLEEAGKAVADRLTGATPASESGGTDATEETILLTPPKGKKFYIDDDIIAYAKNHGGAVPDDLAWVSKGQEKAVMDRLEKIRRGDDVDEESKKDGDKKPRRKKGLIRSWLADSDNNDDK